MPAVVAAIADDAMTSGPLKYSTPPDVFPLLRAGTFGASVFHYDQQRFT
jgi:hypothetical protein